MHSAPSLRPKHAGILLGPAALVIALGLLVPMGLMVDISLRSSYPSGVHAASAYLRFVSDQFALRAAGNTFLLSAIVTLICAVAAYPIAWYLARHESRWQRLVLFAVLGPLLVSIVVRTIGWTILLGNVGLLNNLLLALGLVQEPVRFLGNFWSVTIGMVHVLLPFMVLSIASVLGRIDGSLAEAAATLGASRLQTFCKVIFPLSIQGVAAGSVIVFCLAIGSYITPAWLGRGMVPVLSTNVYQQIAVYIDWPLGAAMAILIGLVALIALFANFLIVRKVGGR